MMSAEARASQTAKTKWETAETRLSAAEKKGMGKRAAKEDEGESQRDVAERGWLRDRRWRAACIGRGRHREQGQGTGGGASKGAQQMKCMKWVKGEKT
jgi:hypothetical protein